MCGIVGVFTPPDKLSESILQAFPNMMASLEHRGPDEQGVVSEHWMILGHQRLSIIDLDFGQQPMHSECGRYVLVFNGEIYNYRELRQTLQGNGIKFATQSDTEVLLQLLIREGPQAISRFNGMFAFCFVDKASGKWIMARDQFGIKPLYYARHDDSILFASEIKAILAYPEFPRQVNQHALAQYFSFQFCLGGNTLFEGIEKLEPAQVILGQNGNIHEVRNYWTPRFSIDDSLSESQFVERLSYLLQDSVRLQLRSDVPVGSYLSGGLDSSAVTVLAKSLQSQHLPTFCGRFSESEKYDESQFAEIVSRQLQTELVLITPQAQDFVDWMPRIIHFMDEPLAGPGVFPQFMVSQRASQQVKVVLGGQGGDEIFGGYARYLLGYLEQALKGSIFETNEEGNHLVSLSSILPNLALLKQYVPLMKQFWSGGLFDEMDARYFALVSRNPEKGVFLSDELKQSLDFARVYDDFRALFNQPDTLSYINKMTHFDFKTLLPALLHVEDRASMAASIESRVPLLDTRIMELIASAPPAMKFKGGQTKALFKKALQGVVPTEVISRKDKMGFPVPLNEWMQKEPVREFVNDVLGSRRALERGIFNRNALVELQNNPGVGARQVWGALSLELWFSHFMEL